MRKVICCTLLFSWFVTVSTAAERTWTGLGNDARWANPQNWSDNTAPVDNTDVAYFQANTPDTVLLDQSISIKTIYFRNPGMTLTIA